MSTAAALELSSLREEIDQLIDAGDGATAYRHLQRLWNQDPSPSLAGFVLSRFERLRKYINPVPCRVAVLRSFTLEPLVPLLRAAAAVNGIDVTAQLGDFNAYARDILDPHGRLYAFSPQVAILAVQTRDIAPELWADFAALTAEDVDRVVERVAADFRNWIEIFRSRSQSALVIHGLASPAVPAQGVCDSQLEKSQAEALRRVNQKLLALAQSQPGVYLLDYDALVARHGRIAWYDERKWLTARMPIAAPCLIHLCKEWLRFLHPLTGKICKAVAVDLDNTLWGGVIGEDGMTGIKLGAEYPGAAYQELQRALLDLYRRGILLAVASKNNPADAMEALERHPGMLLKPTHFASLRMNWNDKAQNLREIAAELNIGIDSIAFLDDNPVEREWVRKQLPEVTVIDLPAEPMRYAAAVRDAPVFERLQLSAEDRQRGQYYAEQRLRNDLSRNAGTVEDYYRSLAMQAEICLVTPQTLARVAQLTQKTNQFNLTTRRYTEQQIDDLAAREDWRVYSIRVRDCFGDNGLVGVALLHLQGPVGELDTFLLSCRVIGRTVETALLAAVADEAIRAGCQQLVGWYLPTKKNAPAETFYASHGFTGTQHAEGSRWELDLAARKILTPPWITLLA